LNLASCSENIACEHDLTLGGAKMTLCGFLEQVTGVTFKKLSVWVRSFSASYEGAMHKL